MQNGGECSHELFVSHPNQTGHIGPFYNGLQINQSTSIIPKCHSNLIWSMIIDWNNSYK